MRVWFAAIAGMLLGVGIASPARQRSLGRVTATIPFGPTTIITINSNLTVTVGSAG